jgi:methanogenic corrinoid protein MtbC1
MGPSFYSHTAQSLRQLSDKLAETTTARQYANNPQLRDRYGAAGQAKCFQDSKHHVAYLAAAVAANCPDLFADYMRWARSLLSSYSIPADDIVEHLRCMLQVFEEDLPSEVFLATRAYFERAFEVLAADLPQVPSNLVNGMPFESVARNYLAALLAADRKSAHVIVEEARACGASAPDLYQHVFEVCQHEIGRLWQLRQITVAQEHFCTAVTQSVMGSLYQTIFDSPRNGRIALVACVGGELHELGARMVADFLEFDGWSTIYLGANTPASALATMVIDQHADVLCLSTTLTVHIQSLIDTIRTVREHLAGRKVPILVGGYPFHVDPNLWQKVGADGWGPDAQSAGTVAHDLLAIVDV